jgi:hypothetical protein
MAVVRIFAGVDSGRPYLDFRNDRNETVQISGVLFQRGEAGSSPHYWPPKPLRIEPHQSSRICGEHVDAAGQSLDSKLRGMLKTGEHEAVIRIRVDLDPPQADRDQAAPSCYVIRCENGRITEFFPLQGFLQGPTSLLDALLESRRHGA